MKYGPSLPFLGKVWVLTENLHNDEGFEQLFSITGQAGKADDLVEKNGQFFIKIKSGTAILVKESI